MEEESIDILHTITLLQLSNLEAKFFLKIEMSSEEHMTIFMDIRISAE